MVSTDTSSANAAASASCPSARYVLSELESVGVAAAAAAASASCTSARHSAIILDSPRVGDGAVCTCLLVGVVGVGGGELMVVVEWFAAVDVDSLVGVVIVGVVVCIEVDGWFAAVGVHVNECLGGGALRWSRS